MYKIKWKQKLETKARFLGLKKTEYHKFISRGKKSSNVLIKLKRKQASKKAHQTLQILRFGTKQDITNLIKQREREYNQNPSLKNLRKFQKASQFYKRYQQFHESNPYLRENLKEQIENRMWDYKGTNIVPTIPKGTRYDNYIEYIIAHHWDKVEAYMKEHKIRDESKVCDIIWEILKADGSVISLKQGAQWGYIDLSTGDVIYP